MEYRWYAIQTTAGHEKKVCSLLLQRIADTVGELIPYDDITFYEANEATQELRAVFASGEDAEKVLADEPFSYGVEVA